MNASTVTAKERGRLILEQLTNAPKKRGRPLYVKITDKPKKRGRPRKEKQNFFTEDCSSRRLKLLSLKISRELHIRPSSLTCQLAEAAVAYKAVTQVRKSGPLTVKGKRNRSNIHCSTLLWDIARILEGKGQGKAAKLLNQMNGYAEESAKAAGKPSTVITDKYARAILAALGEKYASSLRRQASNAQKFKIIPMK